MQRVSRLSLNRLMGFAAGGVTSRISAGHRRPKQKRPSATLRPRFRTIKPRSRERSWRGLIARKKRPTYVERFCFGRDSVGIRTQDPQLRRLLLYPTELPNRSLFPLSVCWAVVESGCKGNDFFLICKCLAVIYMLKVDAFVSDGCLCRLRRSRQCGECRCHGGLRGWLPSCQGR